MAERRSIGIVMNGVTGRMGTNQHLLRSMVEIIKQGGVKTGPGETIMPDPILIGRDINKLEKLSAISGIKKYDTDLDKALADPNNTIYFDAQTTGRRADAIRKAVTSPPVRVMIGKARAASSESAAAPAIPAMPNIAPTPSATSRARALRTM